MNYVEWVSAPGLTATLVTDEQSAWRVSDCFTEGEFADDVAVSLVHAGAGQSRVTLYFRGPMVEALVRDLTISAAGLVAADALVFARIPRKDWVLESLHGLKPVTAGRFVLHGAHDRGCVPANRIGIEIEAAQAFGTGHQSTTHGCLLALDRLCKFAKPRRGASAVACWRLISMHWRCGSRATMPSLIGSAIWFASVARMALTCPRCAPARRSIWSWPISSLRRCKSWRRP